MGTRMLQRRGTAAEWTAANPVLGDGEIGLEKDTGIIKVGNGSSTWSALTNVYRRFADAVAKAGDTMTGNLTISKADPKLLLQETVTDRAQLYADTGMQYLQVDDELSITAIDTPGTLKNLRAGQVFDSGNRVYSSGNPPPATNAFTVIDALGDLLVGSGPDAVARLAKGANGTFLTVDGTGNVAWGTPSSTDNTKVLKAGDSMTGALRVAGGANSVPTDIQPEFAGGGTSPNIGRLSFGDGTGYKLRLGPKISGAFVSRIEVGDDGSIRGLGLYDNGNRVYSASNPPPASGAMINQTIRGVVTAVSGTDANPFTITIASVNMAKTQLRLLGNREYTTNTNVYLSSGRIRLASATSIEYSHNASSGYGGTVSYELTEWT